MYHVTSSSARPDWNEIQVKVARYPEYHGNLLFGLPVAGFTLQSSYESIYPFLGTKGNIYYRVKISFNPDAYYIYKMNECDPPPERFTLPLLCIRKNDINYGCIKLLLGENRKLSDHEINEYFLERGAEGRQEVLEKCLYFIENINIETGLWDRIEKRDSNYEAQNVDNNMINVQLFDAWIWRQVDRISKDFINTYPWNHIFPN